MPTKVCLISSIRNKSVSADAIKLIITALEKKNISILHEHVSSMTQDVLDTFSKNSNLDFHKKIFSAIRASDLIVSECSKESLSVGFLLSYALEHDKPVIIFQKKDSTSPNLFTYLAEEKQIYIVEYLKIVELPRLVNEYVRYAIDSTESRFNFYLSPSVSAYLKWASKKHNQSKSAFVRNVLQEMMHHDKEYLN